MTDTTIGFLHPGAMGASIAAAAAGPRLWVSAGRSPETVQRAEAAGLEDAGTLDVLVERCDVIVSVCPPAGAHSVASDVTAAGFTGVYVDANAISPDRARRIAELHPRFVDGGIVGPPVARPGTTRLYLNGIDAPLVAAHWAGSDLEVRDVDGPVGAASALKMCFAAWTKGSAALLLAVNALAEHEGVRADLLAEWATSMPDVIGRSDATAAGTGPKAWRFVGEMEEIAATFTAAELPDGFHLAAAELYARMADFKGTAGPRIDDVTAALLRRPAE